MNFNHEIDFEQPVDKVISLYKDKIFPLEKYKKMGHKDIVEVSRIEAGNSVETHYRFLMGINPDIPSIAKPFLKSGELLLTSQIERWDFDSLRGSIEVVIEAFKSVTTIKSNMQLVPKSNSCTNTMQWEVDCTIAFIGGKIAKYVGSDVQAKAAAEGDITKQLLLRV